jgi:hypothetical protein
MLDVAQSYAESVDGIDRSGDGADAKTHPQNCLDLGLVSGA